MGDMITNGDFALIINSPIGKTNLTPYHESHYAIPAAISLRFLHEFSDNEFLQQLLWLPQL